MTAQQLAIDPTQDQRSFPVDTSFTAWRFRLAFALICVGAGLLSVILGPDNYWDLRYYHLYAPWAYLHGRYLYDIGPAQEQGFLNPVADFLLYGLISSPLNDFPRIVAFIMGAVHGINAAFVFAIACHVIRLPDPVERWTLRGAAFLMGVSGAGFISLLGGSSNDLTSSLFVLGSLYGVLRLADQDAERGTWPGFTAAGLAAGLGIGLKYTSAIYAPGLGVVAVLAALRRRTFVGLVVFGVAAAVAFTAVVAHHMLTLWHDFGNPFFPYLNQIFKSPYFEPEAIRDDRFVVHGLWQLLTFPFYWTKVTTYVVVELPFRDWRAAIAYVAMVAGVLAFVISRLRGSKGVASAPTRGLALVYLFVVVSYVAWAYGFGYYRYVIPLENLTGVVTMGALIWLVADHRARILGSVLVLVLAVTTTVYLDWGRRDYTSRYIDVTVPPLPANSVVLVATWDPVAYFIPYAEPSAQYVGIENNYLELSQNNKLAAEVKRIMSTPGRPKFVLNVNELDRDKWNALLAQFGLQLSSSPCRPIHSNLEVHVLSLCALTER